MSYKIPLSQKEVVAVQAVLGRTGIIESKDYRDEKVLAGIYPVTGTNWIMIAKIDKNEILSELWYRAIIITLFTVVSILFLITGVSFIYKYRQSIAYKELLKKEKELRENEEVFRITLYSIGDGVITTDTEGCVKQMNFVAEQLTGWGEAESRGRKIEEIFKIINEDLRQTVENPVERVLREGIIVGLANHTLLISKDGKETPIADSGAPIRNDEGEIIGVVLVFRDQTAERDSKKELQQSEDKLRSIFRAAPVGIGLVINRIMKEVNLQLCKITGYSAEELLEQSSRMLYENDEDYKYVGEEKYKQITEKGTGTVTTKWKRKTGEIIYILLSSTPLDINDLSKGVTFSALDVTERKTAEATLKESEKRFRILYENAPLSYQSLDINANIIDVNPTWLSVLGYTREEVIGRNFSEFMTHESAMLIKTRLPAFIANGEIHGYEFEMVRKNGTKLYVSYEGKIGLDKFGAFKQTHCIFSDITESKKAKDALKQSEEDYKTLFNQAHDPIFVFYRKEKLYWT